MPAILLASLVILSFTHSKHAVAHAAFPAISYHLDVLGAIPTISKILLFRRDAR